MQVKTVKVGHFDTLRIRTNIRKYRYLEKHSLQLEYMMLWENSQHCSNDAMENPNDVMVTPLAPAWYRYGLLIVCVMGLCGNMLNLLILRRRRLLATLSSVERSSNRTLIALAMSDLLFCLSLLPAVAYTDEPYTQPFHRRHVLYYKVRIILFFCLSTVCQCPSK